MKRLVEKLHLTEITDLTHESIALHEMVTASSEDPGESIEKMSMLLKRIKDFVQTESPFAGSPPGESSALPSCTGQVTSVKSLKNGAIPDDFRCPISLELMKDPVIVSTGQVFIACSMLCYSDHIANIRFTEKIFFFIDIRAFMYCKMVRSRAPHVSQDATKPD